MKLSKSFTLYQSRKNDTIQHLEVTDASIEFMLTKLKTSSSKKFLHKILNLPSSKYPSLKIRNEQPESILNRIKVNNNEFALRRIYTHFGEYCNNILREIFDVNPMLVIGKANQTLKFHEIVKLADYDRIADHMVKTVFRHIDSERDTVKTIKKLTDGTGVHIPENIMYEAMGTFELRHLIVHNNSCLDQHFCDHYPEFLKTTIHNGSRISFTFGLAKRGINAVTNLIGTIDGQIVDELENKSLE